VESSEISDSPDEQPAVDRFGLLGGVAELAAHVFGAVVRVFGR
jgi:hypothetical protein